MEPTEITMEDPGSLKFVGTFDTKKEGTALTMKNIRKLLLN